MSDDLSRRGFVLAGFAAAAAGVLAACGRTTSLNDSGAPPDTAPTAPGRTLAPTPGCADADDVTPAQTEGPFFKTDSPQRADIRDGAGPALLLTGTVLSIGCEPLAGALLDFWQADADGEYDNTGMGFRGHQFADGEGRYRLDTVVPGNYPGRTRHIHVKVQPPGGRVLTTQIYFPGESRNASDAIYREDLVVDMQKGGDGASATFSFVLET